jgi:uncharacterized membrane protein YphA (DoxX/SURF4 family)
MDVIVLIGRILFVVLFLGSAFGHLTQSAGMAGYAKAKGVPAAQAAVLLSGVLLLVGAVSVLLGIYADLGFLALLLFLLPTAVIMHPFWKETDASAKQMEMTQFLKDLALAGACVMLFALFAYVGSDLGLTLTDPAFDLS